MSKTAPPAAGESQAATGPAPGSQPSHGSQPAGGPQPAPGPSLVLVTMLAFATGGLAANLYYAQPLIALIGPDLGITPEVAGSLVAITQIGYGLGLFFMVPLADLLENRRLALTAIGLTILALIGVASAGSGAAFMVCYLAVGFSATAAQVLLPFAAHLAPEARRGRVVGYVMTGLLTGIMVARPVALFIAGSFGWRAVFLCSAVLLLIIGAGLVWLMPRHKPEGGLSYRRIQSTMLELFLTVPTIRRRAFCQGLMLAAFNIFWVAAPLLLAERFGLTEHEIGIFALIGAGGALAAPIAGRLADSRHRRAATIGCMLTLSACFLATAPISLLQSLIAAAGLAALGFLIDAAVQTNQIISQRIVFTVAPLARGRANAIYMTIVFFMAAMGSLLGTLSYEWGGWIATALTGGAVGAVSLAAYLVLGRGEEAAAG